MLILFVCYSIYTIGIIYTNISINVTIFITTLYVKWLYIMIIANETNTIINITTQTINTIIMISHNITFTIAATQHDTITISLITEIKLWLSEQEMQLSLLPKV